MARMILQVPGEDVTLGTPGQQDSVFGTVGGDEVITVMSGGHVTFDASFGRGGDTIRLPGPADSYSVTLSGSRMILTGADGTVVNLPLGTIANLLAFDGGDARPVVVSDGRAMVGDQPVADGDRLAPPPAGPDTQAPDAPEDVAVSADGERLSGRGEPGAEVRIDHGRDGATDQVGTVGSDGRFEIVLDTPLTNGERVAVRLADAAGNVSAPARVIAPDLEPAPDAPQVNESNGTVLLGSAEPGVLVAVSIVGGARLAEVRADDDGFWSFSPVPPLAHGVAVDVVAVGADGERSVATRVVIDAVAPSAPVIEPSRGDELSGIGEPGVMIVARRGGEVIGQALVDGNGAWRIIFETPLRHDANVSVIARDAALNTSPVVQVRIDAQALMTIAPSNGAEISGTADAGSTVRLVDGSGNPIGQVGVDGNGDWSFTPVTPLAHGTTVKATATDPLGNVSAQASTITDAVAPPAPVIDPSNGSEISGIAESASTVILVDGAGNPIGQVTADGDGAWSFTPGTPLPDGTVINAVARDAAGNVGPQSSTTVDGVAPAMPTVNLSNGSSLSGTAEPNGKVVLTDGGGNPIAEVDVDGSGNWTYVPGSPLSHDALVYVVARDAAGNTSPAASVTIDSLAPTLAINPSNGVAISGTAEPGSMVTLTDGGGNPIGQVIADGSSNWSFIPGSPLSNGTVIVARATDPTGNVSAPATTTVDTIAPGAPVVNPSNGTEVSGTAEPNGRVILTDGSGNPIGQTSADGDGNWSFTPATPLANGTVVNAVAQDAAGNASGPNSITVDGVAPPVPTIDPSHGAVIAGSAEPDSIVTLTDVNGNAIGETPADGTGRWSYTPTSRLPDGTVIHATARDAAGNTSALASTTVTSIINLDDVANGIGGFKIIGEAMNDTAGKSVASAGDIDGDGKADLIIGASRNAAGGSSAGAGYVVLGGAPNPISLADVASGNGGFKITGEAAGDGAGISVSGAGDFNGDGRLDLLIGAYQNDAGGSNAGAVYMVYGTGTLPAAVNLDNIAAGTGGFRLADNAGGNWAGFSVSAAGDVNNDGRDDFIVGVSGDDAGGVSAGAAYVVFGSASPPGSTDLGTVANGTGGFKIVGQNAADHAGWSVSGAGDVNGDGYDDVIVGAYGNNQGGMFGGAAYVVYGGATPPAMIDLDAIAAGNGGFKIFAENASDSNAPGGFNAGNHISVSDAGDVNGDGYDDVMVGLYGNDAGGSNAGAAYVVFGGATNAILNLDNLAGANPGSRGFKIIGEASDDWVGVSVSAAGDVNNDGFDDVIVGADGNDAGGNDAGAAYVIFGRDQPTTVDLDDVATGIGGFKIIGQNAGDWAGRSVSGAGDVNGDGYDDLFVGAEGNNAPFPEMGAGYVIYGSDWPI